MLYARGMDYAIAKDKAAETLVLAALEGTLTEEQAERLAAIDANLQKLAWLAASQRIAEQNSHIAELSAKLSGPAKIDPSTPSGQRPVYAKPTAPKRKGKPGAKKGHAPARRPTPKRIDERKAHRLKQCPCCGGKLQRCKRTRTRTIEDFLDDLRAVVTQHTIHRDYCPKCKKHVEPVVPDAMPKARIGHRALSLTSWLHYGLGLSISQTRELALRQFQTHLSPGGMVAAWQRLAEVLEPWYVQIGEEARASAVLHADETGWRMNGRTWWLWCFANPGLCYYLLDPSRGSPALERFFAEAFDGVLVTDFWAAYNAFAQERQCCLAHLLRELEKVDLTNSSTEWKAFTKKLRRLVFDGLRLRKRADFSPETYASRIQRIDQRLMALALAEYDDADTNRLARRLLRHADELFTFLDYPDVPSDNNLAERMIRPAVILRKNCQSNRSEKGAATQAVLMSIYRTLKLRGHDPLKTIDTTLRTYLTTSQLPPLPVQSVADG
jgi:transposase